MVGAALPAPQLWYAVKHVQFKQTVLCSVKLLLLQHQMRGHRYIQLKHKLSVVCKSGMLQVCGTGCLLFNGLPVVQRLACSFALPIW